MKLGRSLQGRGRSVRTVALVPGQGGGLHVPTLGSQRLGPATLVALRGEARAAKVVIAHGSSTLPACAIATVGTGTPFIYRNIGDPEHWSSAPARRVRTRLLLRQATAVVALSSTTAADMNDRLHVPRARLHVIPTGVAADDFPPVDPASRRSARLALGLRDTGAVVVYLGALSPEKDVGLAIEAVASLPDVHLVVAGDGPDRASLEARATARVPGRVTFVGDVPNARPVLAAADVLVLPSRTEGLPGVLIEAGLSGLPVVATDVGLVREIVVDGETGRLVPAGDATALAAALADVIHDADAVGTAARTRCLERYELGAVAAAWDALIGSLVESNRPAGSGP
jgi:glycosyltransferase involved in cell wall biosynthesis